VRTGVTSFSFDGAVVAKRHPIILIPPLDDPPIKSVGIDSILAL
jgi:hypothetical protein